MGTIPDLEFEKSLWDSGYSIVIGVDEVGRGAFAGPVVAAACVFKKYESPTRQSASWRKAIAGGGIMNHRLSIKIDDSKRLRTYERQKAGQWIKENCLGFGIGEVSVARINKIGIGKANAIAMRKAINNIKNQKLNSKNSYKNLKIFILVDAIRITYLKGIGLRNQKAIIKGDQHSFSIAAASIMAKVYRDRIMLRLSKRFPQYGWGRNKGYGTKEHREAIKKYGVTRFHRLHFIHV